MSNLRVKYDDLEWDDPVVPYGARYNEKKYTGIAYYEDSKWYEEFSYLDGLPNGHFYVFNKIRKELTRENFYDNNIPIGKHFAWVDNFLEKHTKVYNDGEIDYAIIEDNFGNKLFEYSRQTKTLTEWYNCGNLRSEKILVTVSNLNQYSTEKYWHNTGEWLATFHRDSLNEYNTIFLMQHSDNLATEEQEGIFVSFYEYLAKNNKELGIEFLHKNVNHPDPFFRYQIARLLDIARDIKSLPYLRELLNDNRQPERRLTIDWLGHGRGSRSEYSISRMAEIAIKNIIDEQKGSS